MHFKRKILAFIMMVVFIIISILPIGINSIQALENNEQNLLPRQGLSDIQNHWAKEYIEGLYNEYIVNGYPDGNFKPDNSITRAEMAVILINALGQIPIVNPQLTFNDTNSIEAWAAGSIAKLVELNVINGYPDGTFMPNKEIDRCEIAIMVIKSQKITVNIGTQTNFADNELIPEWAIEYVAKAAELKIIIGSQIGENFYFNPNDQATRAEVCVMVDKMRKLSTPEPTRLVTQTPEVTQTFTETPTPTITPIPTVTPTPTPTPEPGFNLIPFDKDTTIETIQPPWKLVGPGGAGAMFTPTVSYTDPNTAMICSDMTGTFITHDGGINWKIINLRTRVDAIAFDPNEPNTIYAASTGLFKSVDGGDSWKLIYPNPNLGISERMIGDHAEHSFVAKDNYPGGITQIIYIDPQNSNNIYLGIKTTTLNIYYSKDKGATWTKGSNFTGTGTDFIKMYIDPNSPVDNRGIYAFTNKNPYKLDPNTLTPTMLTLPARVTIIRDVTCGVNPETNKSIFYLTTAGIWSSGVYMSGVMKSDNNGGSWTEMQAGLNKDLPATGAGAARDFTSIATALNDARTVYVAVERNFGSGGTHLGMFKSVDEGVSWDWTLKVGTQYPDNMNGGWLEREYDIDWNGAPKHLAVGPNNPGTLYYTGIGMAFATQNGGTTWDQIYSKDNPDGTSSSNGLEVTTTYGVHFDPFDRNHMAITYTDMGLSQSYDNGTSWNHAVDGIPYSWKNTCYWMVFDPAVPGRSWSAWSSCHDLPREKMFRAGRLVDRNYPGGVAKSDNNMDSWQVSSNGLPAQTIATHIILDPQSPVNNRTLYIAACGRGVYKSTDDGNTWTLKSTGINTANLNAWRLVLTPDGTLYLLVIRGLVGTTQIDGALYKSTDGADTWEKVFMPAGVNAPNDMISDPTNSLHMYLATWPKKVNGLSESGGLYETTDGGATWVNIFEKTSHVYSVAIDPNDSDTLYIVTFDSAAYMSEDNGKNWNVIKGYDFKWGHRPVPDPYNKGMLYITTFGSSVWYGPAKQE